MVRRVLRIIIIAITSFIVLYFAAVLAGGLITTDSEASRGIETETNVIYLDNNGRHWDIWLPAEYFSFLEPSQQTSAELEDSAPQEAGGWYGFGWGDRDFFLNTPHAGDVKPGLLLKALFIPSRAVLAVQYSRLSPATRLSTVGIDLESEMITAAAEYISEWFLTDGGSPMPVSENLVHPSYKGYRFYESAGQYSLFYTSNNWAGNVLKHAGLSTGVWTPLTFGVESAILPVK